MTGRDSQNLLNRSNIKMENDFLPMDLNPRRFIFESVRFMCRWAVIAWPLITYQKIKQGFEVSYTPEQIKDSAVRAVDAIVRKKWTTQKL